ncbi:hypothetical protein [Niabella aurantiaca]|uniref:hypothetical protein n=1 Tax=Niabella aurantiaca TaxID=379900 RepID=UPI0012FCE34A|nr:hypothetical protein [Niabella aurantiaca]
MIKRNAFPVYGGMAPGQLTLPDSLSTGFYQIRAYSPLMLNQPGFIFRQRIMIYGKENKEVQNKDKKVDTLLFFPEGGSLITGLLNIVAFKSIDKDGRPLPVQGAIRNSKNEIVGSFESVHDGMGSFSITPVRGEHYYAVVKTSGQKYVLPEQTGEGIVLNVTDMPGIKRFTVHTGGNNHLFKPAYMIGQMQNMVIFKQPLPQDRTVITGSIKTHSYYSGILQLTVFNKDDMPLAERITFVDNKEYALPASINVDTLDTGARKHNHFTIMVPDTVIGNFSLSVTDADYENDVKRRSNIYASFLLKSDIKGYIHNPAYYFNTSGDAAKKALELVMMTNGWTRFKWTDLANNQLPSSLYKDPGYLKLSGRIFKKGTKKPLADKDVILILSPADSGRSAGHSSRMIHTDVRGGFEADSLLMYGKTKMVFSEINGRKNNFIRVQLDSNSLMLKKPPVSEPLVAVYSKNAFIINQKMNTAYIDYANAKGLTLKNVIVRASQKTAIDQLDEAYSSGYFSGAVHSYRIDMRNESYAGDFFEYLRERIPGLKVSGEPGDYVLHYRGGNMTYYINNGEEDRKSDPHANTGNVTLFLDEMPANPIILETIPLNDIALIKLFPSSTATAGGGTVLAVYTKKSTDRLTETTSSTDIITYYGYTITKEFYNPDYSHNPDHHTADKRITLKWIPDITVNGPGSKIPVTFYNNDHTKRFKLVAEGITSEGRLLMLEKIIEP